MASTSWVLGPVLFWTLLQSKKVKSVISVAYAYLQVILLFQGLESCALEIMIESHAEDRIKEQSKADPNIHSIIIHPIYVQ